MTNDKDKIHLPQGQISAEGLSVGGLGAGNNATDTGGLDGAGNELGATSSGTDQGRKEAKRMDDADASARRS